MAGIERTANVVWQGSLTEGAGTIVSVTSGAFSELGVTWASRTEQFAADHKTSPEELIAAAHASCFCMALSNGLTKAGSPPSRLEVSATCTLERGDAGLKIAAVDLAVRGAVEGLDQAAFAEAARTAGENCPVSKALKPNVEVRVHPELAS
jgi:osmotically inducible protein OsmC